MSKKMEINTRQEELEKFLSELVYAKYSDSDYAARFADRLIRGIKGERKASENPKAFPWGWSGTWREFLSVSEREWLRSLLFHHQARWSDLPLDSWQVWTWRVQFRAFHALLFELCERRLEFRDALVVFEYELPFEYGHRPDAILVLPSGHVIIVECKNRENFASADRKQVMNYLDVLGRYHSQSRDLTIHPVVLLLQQRKDEKPLLGDGSLLVAHFDGARIPVLQEFIESLLPVNKMIPAPVEWIRGEFKPRNEVMSEFIQAAQNFVDDASTQTVDTPQHIAFLSWADGLAHEAKSNSEHKLVLVSAAASSEVLGIKLVLNQAKKGTGVLFLRGDSPDVAGLARLVSAIDRHSDNCPARAAVRGQKSFCRYSSWNDCTSPAQVYALDQTSNTIWLRPEIVLDVASRSQWALVVVFLDAPQQGRSDGVSTWISKLLFYADRRAKDWTVFAPKQFSFPTSISELARICVCCRPELAFGTEPLLAEGAENDRAFLEQLLKPYLWGQLRKFPQDLKTWEQVTERLATHGYSATPLRNAAKYGDLQHIPPESCAKHFDEAKSIVIKSVEDSRADGRFERRVEARRWLIKAALAGNSSSEVAIQRAIQTIDELVADGISAKKPPAVFNTPLNAQPKSPEDLLRQFVCDGQELLIDIAIAERFLNRVAEFEQHPKLVYKAVNQVPIKAEKSLSEQMDFGLSETPPNEPF